MFDKTKYFSAVRSVIPYAFDICQPRIQGSLRSVFIVKSADGDFICKFNHREMAIKNATVASVLLDHGVPAPQISVHNYKEFWFELYPMIRGQTLYEYVGQGMNYIKMQHAYKSLVDGFARMDEINVSALNDLKYKYTHQVAKQNITDTNNRIMANVFSGAVRLMNRGTNAHMGVYHCGITPKNVVLNENADLMGLLDMDEVSIADRNYAFAMMAAKYQQFGYDVMDLVNYYELKTGNELDHNKIKNISNLINAGKYMLWRTSHKSKSR